MKNKDYFLLQKTIGHFSLFPSSVIKKLGRGVEDLLKSKITQKQFPAGKKVPLK
jgi:hypothetical protein